ncbi:MAG: alcohol dehydrogenase catalytic domain-containing protein [Georgfuchsia sp.]
MRAAVFIKAGQPLELQDLPEPTPGPGEVVLRVERCGICGTDLHMTEGHAMAFPPGFIPGHESGTEVVAVGKGVDTLKIGDHVVPHPMRGCGKCADCLAGSPYFCSQTSMCSGGYGQYMVTGAATCVRLPKTLSLADAAIVEPMAVGLLGIDINPFPPGARIVVLGAGPIGLASIFWARRTGAGRIVAVASSRRREALAQTMGADAFYTMSDTLTAELTEYLGGSPDVVIECVGNPGMIDKAVEIVKPRGSVTVLGLCVHSDPWMPAMALVKEVKLQFAVGTNLKQFTHVADVIAAGHVEPLAMVTDTISLDQVPATFEALRARTSQCKVLINPWA